MLGAGYGVLGVFQVDSVVHRRSSEYHVSFRVAEENVDQMVSNLRERGIEPGGPVSPDGTLSLPGRVNGRSRGRRVKQETRSDHTDVTFCPGLPGVSAARRLVPLSLVALLAATLPGGGTAQSRSDSVVAESPSGETATLQGTVASRIDGRGVSGARVFLRELNRGGISEPDGTFEIADLPPGEYYVAIEYFGLSTNERLIELRAGHLTRVAFLLQQEVLEVAGLVVEVRRPPQPAAAWMEPFRQRMAEGFGHFVTREDIEERRPRLVSDLFRRIPGIYVTSGGFAGSQLLLRRGGRQCEPALWVDGILTGRYPIDDLHPDDIEGIEVYRRASETPLQFNRGSCGSILIWTRSGGEDDTDREL